jgi:hypothetical protein
LDDRTKRSLSDGTPPAGYGKGFLTCFAVLDPRNVEDMPGSIEMWNGPLPEPDFGPRYASVWWDRWNRGGLTASQMEVNFNGFISSHAIDLVANGAYDGGPARLGLYVEF